MIKAAGAVTKALPCKAENNYEIIPEELEKAVTPNTKLLILNSPSNPTGAVYKRKTLEAIAEIAVRKNFMVMSDEIYSKLVYDSSLPHVSIASFSKEIADLTITIDGFSKAYSMTGWRLGYLSAPLWLTKRIVALQSHTVTNTATFAMYGALAALTEKSSAVEEMRQAFAVRRDLIYKLVSDIPGVRCIKPSGAFYLFFDISSFGIKSAEFCDRLLNEAKVAAIPGAPFGAEGHVRFSYACSEKTIEKAVSRLADFCKRLK